MKALVIVAKILALVVTFFALFPLHALALRFEWPIARRLPMRFHRVAVRVLGARIVERGTRPAGHPSLVLSNHCSWIDIVVLASLAPVSFVAKSEVAGWPVFGFLARMQRSIFIDRNSRRATGEASATIARRLARGELVVLFAEGTTSDGNRVLPFRASLVGAARMAVDEHALDELALQPLAITYIRRNGLPLARAERPDLCWYGDMDLVPHLAGVLTGGPFDVVVHWGEPIPFDSASDRKHATREAWMQARRFVSDANAGRLRARSDD
ncbi:MAG: 1-acyl-sn-glycerol-3-phosphate acyltransferase [Salinarimonadaceae bacterium]|nr:MAG: 1-acyl-sn-glycerol-3-phosphate acyltransferase [Salinarimonadaceae bacterium]